MWLTIAGMGVITYSQRLLFIALHRQLALPEIVRQSLRFVPPAVLSAIIFPELFMPADTLDISLSNFRMIAGILAGFVAWRTRNVLLTIASGMVALWALQYLFR